MMNRASILCSSSLVALACAAAGVQAQPSAWDSQNKLLARRAAEADCYRKLAETVYGVRINTETYVRDFVTERDEIRSAVDSFVQGIRLGSPRYYDDGTCEVDAEVTVAKLVTKLTEIHLAHYEGSRVTRTDIENIKNTVKTNVFRVTGSGVPRPELPDVVADMATPLPPGVVLPAPAIPAIWRSVPPQARMMAERAAQMDSMRKLLEQIKGLRLNSNTLVRDFITESDEISARADGIVYGAVQVAKYLRHDELVAEVTMEVPVERLVTKIQEMHAEFYHGGRVTTTDITNVRKKIHRNMIRITGSGVPPARFLGGARSAGVVMPEWFDRRLAATGQATDPRMSTAQGKLRAARAARLDALRKLAEQVDALTIISETTVRDFVTERDEIAAQVQSIIAGAVAAEATFADDVASVTVSIPASEIWSVVHQEMVIEKRRG